MQMRKYSTHPRAEKRGSKGTLSRAATTGTGAPPAPSQPPPQPPQPPQQVPAAASVPALEQSGEASPGEEEEAMAGEMGARDEGCVQMVLKLIARMCDGQNTELQVLSIYTVLSSSLSLLRFYELCWRARFSIFILVEKYDYVLVSIVPLELPARSA